MAGAGGIRGRLAREIRLGNVNRPNPGNGNDFSTAKGRERGAKSERREFRVVLAVPNFALVRAF
jgi:hypothetical protein